MNDDIFPLIALVFGTGVCVGMILDAIFFGAFDD